VVEPVRGLAEQDRVGERLAEQPRHLREIRGPGRHEHAGRVGHRGAVPPDRAGVGADQAQQGPQQGRLARPDRAGDHDQFAAADHQVDAGHAAPRHGVAHGDPLEPDLLQAVARVAGPARRGKRGRAVAQPGRRGGDDPPAVGERQQLGQPVGRDVGLPLHDQVAADPLRQLGDHRRVRHEQAEVADRQVAPAERGRHDDEGDTRGDLTGAVAE
jgi:hypothetical protein